MTHNKESFKDKSERMVGYKPEVSVCPFYSSSWAETAVGSPVSTASTTMSGNATASSSFLCCLRRRRQSVVKKKKRKKKV